MKIKHLIILPLFLFIFSCSTGSHSSFITHTYIDKKANIQEQFIGRVSGESSQIWFLYLFPIGGSPSTLDAVNDAKSKVEGTKYLSDLSIDDQMIWKIGYRKQTIKVTADARN